MNDVQRTLVLVKPDGVRRGLVGQIIARYEAKGLRITQLQMRTIDADMAARHYAEHYGKDYYPALEGFITSGPIVAMVLEGYDAIEAVRTINGSTNGTKAHPGTIRGDYGLGSRENLVHASDSAESAEREITLWFPEKV